MRKCHSFILDTWKLWTWGEYFVYVSLSIQNLIAQYVRDLTPRRIIHKINFPDRLYEEQFLRSICSRQVSQEVVPPQDLHCTFISIFQSTFATDIVGESHIISFKSTYSRVLPPRQISLIIVPPVAVGFTQRTRLSAS